MRFDLEDSRQPLADIDGSGVFAGSLEHAWDRSWEGCEDAPANSCSCSAPTTSRKIPSSVRLGSRPNAETMR